MTDKPRALLAPDRVRIYLSLVPYLAERGQVSVDDAAADFGVTPDEMRTMAEKLTVIGVPGESGVYLDPDLFNINWDLLDSEGVIELTNTVALQRAPKLSAREAAALLSGLQLLRSVPEVDHAVVDELIAKLAAGTATTPADVIVAPAAADRVRTIVSQALKAQRAISFTYRKPDAEATTRTVDPVKVHITSGEWYLQGWCHLRRAMRTFHLDRVSDIVMTDIVAEHSTDQASALFSDIDDGAVGVIRYPQQFASLVGEYLSGAETTVSGRLATSRITLSDPLTLKRLATNRAGIVEVTEPSAARHAAHAWAQAALEQYEQPSAS